MKPYYEHGGITIYHGDCREILPTLPKVDLVLTDPPYGIDFGSEKESMSAGIRKDGTQRKYNEWSNPTPKKYEQFNDIKPDQATFDLIFKASENQIIWGGNYFQLPTTGGWLVWDKMVVMPTLSKCELAWTNFMEHIEIKHYLWAGFRKEKPEERWHPTQKPIEVIQWAINVAPKHETILDPFMGSGTTLRAAKDLGRKAIGIEIEEKYCDIAVKRLQQEVFNF
jgi:DNA modification methylase